jgi:hypothetical protein
MNNRLFHRAVQLEDELIDTLADLQLELGQGADLDDDEITRLTNLVIDASLSTRGLRARSRLARLNLLWQQFLKDKERDAADVVLRVEAL